MKARAGTNSRLIAARVLDAVLHRGRSLKSELGVALPQLPDARDRALVEAIVLAALRQRHRYADVLANWMEKPPGRRDGIARALLYVGLAQLDALKLPAHASVDATVQAARAAGRTRQAGLINAVLRRATREPLPPGHPEHGWPKWLFAKLHADWPDQIETILEASAVPPPMWLRVNATRSDRDAYKQRLDVMELESHAHEALAQALRLDEAVPVAQLPGFSEGDVSVQDGSAQWVADALAPAAGARVLDACAAPGGKAAHLLERDPTLRLVALDIDPARMRRMREGFERLGVSAQAIAGDAAEPSAWWDGVPFDTILLDAPCSATGIVRRQPDVLLHRREADIAALTALQSRMLDALWPLLAPGGVLLYATCSILPDENARQVAAFLSRTPDAASELLDERFGRVSGVGRQRLPGEDGMDGFFYARLRKAAEGATQSA